jgi:hypothetical protein
VTLLSLKEVEFSSAIHLTLYKFQLADLAFCLEHFHDDQK